MEESPRNDGEISCWKIHFGEWLGGGESEIVLPADILRRIETNYATPSLRTVIRQYLKKSPGFFCAPPLAMMDNSRQ